MGAASKEYKLDGMLECKVRPEIAILQQCKGRHVLFRPHSHGQGMATWVHEHPGTPEAPVDGQSNTLTARPGSPGLFVCKK
jgi:hypothetical protein